MENNGVKFTGSIYNDNIHISEKFTFSVDGDKEDYLITIQALLRILGLTSSDIMSQNDRYRITSLIEGMLPSLEQLESLKL